MAGIQVEWDEAKNLANQRKHGLSFEEAMRAFLDPLCFSVLDRIEDGEERWQTFGMLMACFCSWSFIPFAKNRTRYRRLSASSRRAEQTVRKGDAMKTKIVRFDLNSIPPLTEAQRKNLKMLSARPDSEIDTSDAPEMTDEQWKNAERRTLYRPVKRQITARVDADVLEWLKAHGKGYQSRINAILRREMLASAKSATAK